MLSFIILIFYDVIRCSVKGNKSAYEFNDKVFHK